MCTGVLARRKAPAWAVKFDGGRQGQAAAEANCAQSCRRPELHIADSLIRPWIL
jgi:hypothetical protein